MSENDEFDILRNVSVPEPRKAAREAALRSALDSFDEEISTAPQGSAQPQRQSSRMSKLWSAMMDRKLVATPAIAGLLALPVAGYATWQLMEEGGFGFDRARAPQQPIVETKAPGSTTPVEQQAAEQDQERSLDSYDALTEEPAPAMTRDMAASPPAAAPAGQPSRLLRSPSGGASKLMVLPPQPEPFPEVEENRDRFQNFDTNPVRSALESPVSTFSIDVDTASYSFIRRALKEGFMPNPDSVRVEEMINYFPYDWAGPESAETPFNSTITVMPTPWNEHTRLMHVAIKGYDMQPAERPQSNLVFLIDTSGSMNAPDKLPLLRSAFRLLVSQLDDDDTVSIVTYAGSAGTVLEPTKGSDRAKILAALDNLEAGGRTAGEAGIQEAYRLAEQSFVEGGVNRVMLATDGDFNIGPSSDEELKTLIEEKRESGVFLSVFGFGRGNLNDQLMQTIAQNGNGTAAYIDTLAEAEKALVEEAGSTLFPIAKDVKIQVEFNPEVVSEYRLIGYETRALNREDFNNDRVDAGEIGSGHSVTAIYEITPKGSPAELVDALRYGSERPAVTAGAASDEYAFVKIRYKAPDSDTSELITTPVTSVNEVASFDAASTDQRFSVAVAAFGQKLRKADATAGLSFDEIMQIATAARGSDPFGYRAEFLSMVRLASALDEAR
ncbi:MAG: VWA domain-containing protein [Rhizobiaceae bacterium]|nr:VWA domain-containing protein [Rhizobiaceae bacterium]